MKEFIIKEYPGDVCIAYYKANQYGTSFLHEDGFWYSAIFYLEEGADPDGIKLRVTTMAMRVGENLHVLSEADNAMEVFDAALSRILPALSSFINEGATDFVTTLLKAFSEHKDGN